MTDIDDYCEPEDDREPDWDDDCYDDREPPSEPDWDAEDYYRRMALSPLKRLAEDVRGRWLWRTWPLKRKIGARWSRLLGRPVADPDEPPF